MISLGERFEQADLTEAGMEMHRLAADLYPICRSITGNGIRETLRRIKSYIPIEIHEVESGTTIFDWTVPPEWNIREAYLKGPDGNTVVDFHENNLHVLNYSMPIHTRLPLCKLKEHLFTLPDHPDWIPYRTSYYKPAWGFCMSHKQMLSLREGEYEVFIDTTLEPGHLTYGECYLSGQLSEEVLISVHACHPSLANDNLSGLTVATFLARLLEQQDRRYSYRFLFIPGTIGAITWLAKNREAATRIRHGLVLTCVGDGGGFHYKKSRRDNAEIDRAMTYVLRKCGEPSEVLEFSPFGYDERQYCSPGFNLPVGCLMRSVWGTFPEYHTSADNLNFIHPPQLARALRLCVSVFDVIENNRYYLNRNPCCEPQLGKRNLYRSTGGESIGQEIDARLWILNFSDGEHSLLDIAERSGLPFATLHRTVELLCENGLLVEVNPDPIARNN